MLYKFELFRDLKILWGYFSLRRRSQFGLLALLILFVSFAEIFSIGLIIPFLAVLSVPNEVFNIPYVRLMLDFFNISQTQGLLLTISLTFMFAIFLATSSRLLFIWMASRLSFAAGSDLSIEIYRRTLFQPYSIHISRNSSEIINVVGMVNNIIINVINPTILLFSNVIILAVIWVGIFIIDPFISSICFAGFSFIYFCISRASKRKLLKNSDDIAKSSQLLVKALQEGLGGIRDVILNSHQELFTEIYKKHDVTLRQAQATNQFISNFPRYVVEGLSMLLISVFAFYLAQKSENTSHIIPVLAAFAFAAQRILPLLQQLYSSWASIKTYRKILSEIIYQLELPIFKCPKNLQSSLFKFNKTIRIKNLFFKYEIKLNWLIRDINMTIRKGSIVGIIGKTGSGKSTLVDILMGLLPPTKGSIEIDGVKINDANRHIWQNLIAHVPQVIYLSDSTVAENIAFGIPIDQIDFRRVSEAAEKAQIASEIKKWPLQFNTPVGERGVKLSGGQRQRIGLARAFYKKTNIIILDEATSALDNKTERLCIKALGELGKDITLVIISHRSSTLKFCSMVYKISDVGGICITKNLNNLD